jgi:hypothetical protein
LPGPGGQGFAPGSVPGAKSTGTDGSNRILMLK